MPLWLFILYTIVDSGVYKRPNLSTLLDPPGIGVGLGSMAGLSGRTCSAARATLGDHRQDRVVWSLRPIASPNERAQPDPCGTLQQRKLLDGQEPTGQPDKLAACRTS
jgi:hypothetical protein